MNEPSQTASLPLAPGEDLVHEPEPNRAWRESYHFGFGDPASGRFGYATFGKRPLTRRSGFLIAIWDPDEGFLVGQDVDRFERHDDEHDVAGLTTRCVEPFKEWDVAYRGSLVRVPRIGERRFEEARAVPADAADVVPVELAFTWRASAPAHAYTWRPAWRSLFHGRHEQPGDCDGHLTVAGARTEMRGWNGIRDHAWGAREWFGTTDWRWISATFETAPHLSLLYAKLDDGTAVVDGALYDERSAARIVEYSERDVEEIPAAGKPEPVGARFTVRDETGRTLDVAARVNAMLPIRFQGADDEPVSWNDRCVMTFEAAHGLGIGEMEFMAVVDPSRGEERA